PSWLYSVTTGSTTIWESWYALRVYADGSSKANGESFNHFSYGAVSEWLYRYVLGIERDDENSNSFKHFLLKPQFGGSFTHANGSYQSPRGYIASGWTLDKTTGAFTYNATVPANTTATLYLPVQGENTAVYEGGVNAAEADGITAVEYADGHMVYELESGSYSFTTIADADMNSFASVKVENKQGIAATLTADGRTYTQFPASVISGNSKMTVSMVSNNEQYIFRNFVTVDGTTIGNGDEISGDNDIDAVFAYTGTDDGADGKKTIIINGDEGIEISVNGEKSALPYTGQFDKKADVEVKILSVPDGYEFAGLDGIASLTDCAYIMPLCDITTNVNIANERYREGYDIFFDFEDSLEEWHGASSTVTITHKNDYMHFESLIKSDGTYDPRIYYNFYGDSASATGGQYLGADKYDSIIVGFTANEISADTTPCMFVSTEEQPVYTNPVRRLYAASRATVDMADGELHEITFNVGSWSAWTGNIKDIYLDVVDNAYADLNID
ncbi:MAG: hypothetical protein IJ365_08285, partial [Clostridia bacterium]|nr:hypothetical protein [Clostridia bacterium]